MAKFKDLASGNVFEFKSSYDVEQMRKHPDYVEVKEVEAPKETSTLSLPQKNK
jgi:hypothetical protein